MWSLKLMRKMKQKKIKGFYVRDRHILLAKCHQFPAWKYFVYPLNQELCMFTKAAADKENRQHPLIKI